MRFRLEKIEVEGFKAFSEQCSLNLDAPIVVILGPIGTGKTSILEAIEYALYGILYSVKVRRELKVEDLINDFSNGLSVKLVLKDEKGARYEVYRARDRAGRVEAFLKMDGEVVEEEWSRVDAKIEQLLGVSLDSYARQIALRHREIEDIIYGTDMQRSEAFDRLLGIETLEKIFRGIPLKIVEDELSRVENEIDVINIRLEKEGAIEDIEKVLEEKRRALFNLEEELKEKENLLSKYREELRSLREKEKKYEKLREKEIQLRAEVAQLKKRLKFLEREVPEENLEVLIEKVRSSIISALKEAMAYKDVEEVEKLKFTGNNLDSMLKVFREKLRKLEASLDTMNEEMLDVNYQLASERNRYNTLKRKLADLEAKLHVLEKDYNTFRSLVEKYGSRGEVHKKIEELEIELGKIDKLIEVNACVSNLGKYVVSTYLKDGEASCPVCGSEIDEKAVRRIEERLSSLEEEEIVLKKEKVLRYLENLRKVYSRLCELEEKLIEKREIEREKLRFTREFEEVSSNIEELEELVSDISFRINKVNSLISSSSSTVLKLARVRELAELREELEAKKRELGKILKEMAKLNFDRDYYNLIEEKYYAALNEFNSISSQLKKLSIEVEDLKEKLAYVRELTSKKIRLEKKAAKLAKLREELVEVKAAFREIQSSIRRIVVEKIVEKMNEVFQQMYVHPDFSELTIEIRNVKFRREGKEYERSMYEILAKRTRDGKWIPALKKMSDGQKRIVVLSLLTALFKLSPHNVSFVILDEPTPSIDYECRKAMIKMLAKIEGIDQIIVATQDESFRKIVQDEPAALIYELKHGKEGARIELVSQPILKTAK